MTKLLQSLSERERGLLGGAGVLFALLILIVGVYLPMREARDEANERERFATDSFEMVATLAAEAKRLRQNGTVSDSRAIMPRDVSERVLISRSARQAGIIISRIQPTDSGALTLWIDSVSSQAFFVWVKALDTSYGISPNNVSLQPEADGMVRVQIEFQGVTS